MFWKKKQDRVIAEPVVTAEAMKPAPKSKKDELEEAAIELASSLRRFCVAVFVAVAAGCGAEPSRLRSAASRRGLMG